MIGATRVPLLAPAPVPLVVVAAAWLLHARACSILADRGRRVPGWQRASFASGLLLILLATQTFIDPVGENGLLSLHMLQHMLIADLPAPLLLLGVRAPLLYFFWPRPVLVFAAHRRLLRALWGWLRRPRVALTTWLVVLYAWHLPVMYELALRSRIAHDLEHVSFALTGVLAWWPLLDPTHDRVVGRLWKAGYVVIARLVGGVLGVVLIAWPTQLYTAYGDGALAYGTTVLADQQSAGGIMMLVDVLVMIVGGVVFVATISDPDEQSQDRHADGGLPLDRSSR